MTRKFNNRLLPIIEIPSPATPETILSIAEGLTKEQLFDFRIEQLGGVLNFPDYPLTINLDSRLVSSRKVSIETTNNESRILGLLAINADTPLSRDEILYQAWGENCDLDPHTVDVHNSNLRSKIVKGLEIPYPIRTIRGLGFVFDTIPVKKIE